MTESFFSLPVLGFAGFSGVGKTTLLEALIPCLIKNGLRIAMIKHAHHYFDIDIPGKDSFKLRKAGADQMLISSRYRNAFITETPDNGSSLAQLIDRIDNTKADLILVEGFKEESIPKIELYREQIGKPFLYPNDSNIIAIACDTDINTSLPNFNINDIEGISFFILQWIKERKQSNIQLASCDISSKEDLSFEQAKEIILNLSTFNLATEKLPLEKSHNRILAFPMIAPVNVPASTNSAMDGFAIQFSDIKKNNFTLVGCALAGHPYEKKLHSGQCIRITTGASIPKGADTIIIKEQAIEKKGIMQIDLSKGLVKEKQHIRQAGEDLKKGSVVFDKGIRINASQLGMLASLGLNTISVFKRIKVALLSTGDEIISPGQNEKSHCIYDTNRYTLKTMLKKLGCTVIDLGIILDEEKQLENCIKNAVSQADVIISSGGVSVGEADFIKKILLKHGQIHFSKINMRPGRPFTFAQLKHCLFFGLPGNPVAAMITFLELVEPSIRQLQGDYFWHSEQFSAITTEIMHSKKGRTEFIRGFYTTNKHGQIKVKTLGNQGSGILRSMSEANCLIKIMPEIKTVQKEELVTIIPLTARI